jgi:hypothetical protein
VGVEVERDVAQPPGLVEESLTPSIRMNSSVTIRPCRSVKVFTAGRSFASGIGLVDRHDPGPHLVGRPVERDREPEAERLVGELQDLGDEPLVETVIRRAPKPRPQGR